jgi:hypothetical protein
MSTENAKLDDSERKYYLHLIELQNAKIGALEAEFSALKSFVYQLHATEAKAGDKSSVRLGKRQRIPTIALESGSPVLLHLQKLIDDARTELIAHPQFLELDKDAPQAELNGLIFDALPQWLQLELQHHFKLSQTQLLDLSFEEFCKTLLEFGLDMDHRGQYSTFFQRHGSIRAAIMSGSSLSRPSVRTRAPGPDASTDA